MPITQGLICMWSGAVVDIPASWELCDGSNGKPDLRDQFIVGSGDTYNQGDTGGAINHNHTLTTNGHTHTHAYGAVWAAAIDYPSAHTTEVDTATTALKDGQPPYYALCYIIKV